MKKILALLLALAMVFSLAACGSKDAKSDDEKEATVEDTENTEETEAEVDEEQANEPEAGFTEIPIFEDEEVEFINVSAVYFQPVPMAPGQENIEGFDMHLECDVSALPNDLGYGVGDWIPYLTIDYAVIREDGTNAAEGTFMEMAASDGPHYGANIALPEAGTYTVQFTIHSPEENNYLIHSDAETGPGGLLSNYFADGNLVVTYEGWEYVPQEW